MKKNMLAVLVLVVCIVNLTLSAYMVFTVIPNAQRTDELITKILQIVDLELESPLPVDINNSYNIEDIEKYELDEMQTNLAMGADGKAHFAMINASLTINTAHEDYEKYGPKVETMKADIKSYVIKETSKCTYEELITAETKEAVKAKILEDIQVLFNSKFIVDCTVDFLFQ